ncbi:hypothetical protein [Glycomyces arizonensis]|uniref:hypothetical protein n=1 Tax=Glycomyces arizonensis TaxID=256035 RepID=UPI00146FBE82|nr:hypothetical protein [Glycomyces arizonensis]
MTEPGRAGEPRSRRGFTTLFGRLFGTGAAEARVDTVEDIAPRITDPDDRRVTIQGLAAEWRGSSLRRFLLLGEPGSGKTSVLVNLLRALVNDESRGDAPSRRRRDAGAPEGSAALEFAPYAHP